MLYDPNHHDKDQVIMILMMPYRQPHQYIGLKCKVMLGQDLFYRLQALIPLQLDLYDRRSHDRWPIIQRGSQNEENKKN